MFGQISLILAVVLLLFVLAGFVWKPARKVYSRARLREAKRSFHRCRERLEARFVRLATAKFSDHDIWLDCDFDDDVVYVRHRETGEMSALVGVSIRFDQPHLLHDDAPFGDRRAVAWFRFDGRQWQATERPLMNLTPGEAIERLGGQLELLGYEPGRSSKALG